MSATGVSGLLRRVLGVRAAEFEPRTLPANADGSEMFEVGHESGRVVLAGTTPIAQAAALRAYLRERCATQVSTDVAHPSLPEQLPVGAPIRRTTAFPYRYHFNVVTYAYTMAWWDWPRWERELDRLAMHGVNRPLIMTGHEAVTQRVFADLGRAHEAPRLDPDTLRGFLSGPAYLPFTHLGCLAGLDGPLRQSWIDRHADLAARIVARARELGMRPVLPAFAGHVPAALADHAATRPVDWAGFRTHALDPRDPLFADLGARFIRAQHELFDGTDHLYAADPFIEMTPPTRDATEIAAVAQAIYTGMRAADDEAIWLLQSWPFTYHEDYWTAERVRAFLDAVPDDRMLILDLWSEHRPVAASLDSAKPWIWCMLHNFGGRPGMYGKLGTLAYAPARSGAAGVGATMEDLGNDPVCYELLADVVWSGTIDLDTWLDGWVIARYGPEAEVARTVLRRAWGHLATTVYDSYSPGPSGAVMLRRPRVDGDLIPSAWLASESPRWLSVPPELYAATRLLADALQALGPVAEHGPLGRDLTDVLYVVVSTLGNAAQAEAARAYTAGDADSFTAAARRFLASIDDLDRLLATRSEYLLGRWLTGARHWGESETERDEYESDARRLITVWGRPDGELVDYARRGWAGLLGRYYRHRWRQWVDELAESLSTGTHLDAEGFDERMRTFELAWVDGTDPYPTEPVDETSHVAAELTARWC